MADDRKPLIPHLDFLLGTHHASQRWWNSNLPLFVSRRTLTGRKSLPEPLTRWALDSGGFTELNLYGHWRTTEDEYVADVERFAAMGHLAWVAPQDWMCEPFILAKSGGSVAVHQKMTVENFLRLRARLGDLVIPVLQGWTRDDYHLCWALYEEYGVDLEAEALVGLGSVCRRQNTAEAAMIVRSLAPLRLHGFGVKITGLEVFADALVSADSMAWSYDGRRLKRPCREGKRSCANCLHHALAWRANLVERLGQQRMEVTAA